MVVNNSLLNKKVGGKKIKRRIGVLSKIRYFADINTLIKLYYALIYPFITYGIIAWGSTYPTSLNFLYVLQKKAVRIITFSKFDSHSSPIFKILNIIKLTRTDLFTLSIIIFISYHHDKLPPVFHDLFVPVKKIHSYTYIYNTRLASKESYSLPKTRTNFGIFNIRYQGPKIWNSLGEDHKKLSVSQLKTKLIKTTVY